jgi:uncharacterized membrane protein YfcA
MEIVTGYIGAFIIGLILGLMGGGGSILTVPLLVYIMGINPVIATAYSLFIVGTTSAFGSIQNHFKGNISYKTGFTIAIPSFIAVYLTRRFIVPVIPDTIVDTHSIIIHRNTFIMVLFAIIMLMASISMLTRKINDSNIEEAKQLNYLYILPSIAAVGIFMGVVGAGGGFLMIPMLVFFGGLPMKKAIGTSLFIIAINSLIGFSGDVQTINIGWHFLLSFTVISVFGIFVGTYLHKFINGRQLKRGFGWFILLMAAFILSKEIVGF